MRLHTLLSILLLSAGLAGCQSPNPYADPALRHRTTQGFRNNYADTVPGTAFDLLRWRWEAWRQDLPPAPKQATPVVAPDLPGIHGNAVAGQAMQPAVTWIGHATALVQASGLNVLTDPMFSERASPFQWIGPRRSQPPGVALAELPAIDVVLVSHNHYDHLDAASVQALNTHAQGATLFLVPLGLKRWFADLGVSNVEELDWWQSRELRGVQFNLTPVQHWSARGIGDRRQTLWGGWAVFAPDFHWYFSGDSGYSQDFKDTRTRFAAQERNGGGFDLALIAVGAYEPTWFMQGQHVNPAQAVQVHRDLGAKRSMGVHWGTFNLADEALDQPPLDLAAARQADSLPDGDFFVLAIGETRRFAHRPAP